DTIPRSTPTRIDVIYGNCSRRAWVGTPGAFSRLTAGTFEAPALAGRPILRIRYYLGGGENEAADLVDGERDGGAGVGGARGRAADPDADRREARRQGAPGRPQRAERPRLFADAAGAAVSRGRPA